MRIRLAGKLQRRVAPFLVAVLGLIAWLADAVSYPLVSAYDQSLTVDHSAAEAWLSSVATVAPSTPTTLIYRGYAAFSAAQAENGERESAQSQLRAAAGFYEDSLVLRPTNPWAWFKLAQTQVLLLERPAITFGSLYNAYLYGRNEQGIREPLLKYVSRIYLLLPPQLQEKYLALMARDVEEGRQDIIKYAVQGGYWQDLRPHVRRPSQLAYARSLLPPGVPR